MQAAVLVVGGGPAGMMASIRASELIKPVFLLEKNETLGKKLLLTGKGRANITNIASLGDFLGHFGKNGEFLRDAFKNFFNNDLIEFFKKRGLSLKVERQGRVFPCDDKSNSVLEALEKALNKNKVFISYRTEVKEIRAKEDGGFIIRTDKEDLEAKRVILACGGVSFPQTGSTGQGFILARRLGHTINNLQAGLVPLETKEKWGRRLQGLTLKNIRLNFLVDKKKITTEIGELLFTHFGVSGPLILENSAKVLEWLNQNQSVILSIDLKPALDKKALDLRLQREIKNNPKMFAKNLFKGLLPHSLIRVFLEHCLLKEDILANNINREQRIRLVNLLKDFRLTITQARPIREAMVTCGGIKLKEINPKTMESRLIKGLYFAGEMIDVAANSGGFNLQAAFSTGYLAGECAANSFLN